MQTKLHWTLVALATLGGTARADDEPRAAGGETMLVDVSGSHRGVAQDYIVLPEGGELTAQMRFVTSEPMLGGEPLRFSDLALFGISGRWSLFSKLELSGEVTLLPKQPSYTDEKPWQSVGGTLRSPLGKRVALAISGAGGHLIDHEGKWLREAMTLQWRKRIDEIMTFDISAGIDGVGITAPDASSAFMTEVALGTSALFREPSGHWGAWVGIAYAVPVTASGSDPTTGLTIDPQPRLDLRVGTVLSLVRAWDVFAEFAVIDRGDLADPTTRLPILDGGFDQRQIMLGVTRHIDAPKKRRHDPMELSVR